MRAFILPKNRALPSSDGCLSERNVWTAGKTAARRAGLPVQELDYVHVPDKGYWRVKEPNQIKSVQNRGTFNPDDSNIYKAFPWAMGGAGTAAALSPGEARAARPKYMEELVETLKSGKFEPGMDFGEYSARDLKKKGLADNGFTPGPVRLSPKNMAKLDEKRIEQNHMSPEEFVDGLNSVMHGTRGRTFPNRDELSMRLVPETEWKGDEPFVRHRWKGVIAPHEGFSGLVTGYKYKPEDAKKTCSGSRVNAHPHHSRHPQRGPSRSRAEFLLSENRYRSFMRVIYLILPTYARASAFCRWGRPCFG